MESKANADEARKRKTHKKSRKGCANCKLRRVKVRQHQILATQMQGDLESSINDY